MPTLSSLQPHTMQPATSKPGPIRTPRPGPIVPDPDTQTGGAAPVSATLSTVLALLAASLLSSKRGGEGVRRRSAFLLRALTVSIRDDTRSEVACCIRLFR
ncbi:hypothetical protein RRG08_013619 [Elysia crispata]|uniref:Uncharacterized protein n=1 Tax=Elysia crispata TaxID=231223 RepID=A0AAE0YE27_9GAST|nr:hypothetical protein RRG08_013619 [Elysia crispata]